MTGVLFKGTKIETSLAVSAFGGISFTSIRDLLKLQYVCLGWAEKARLSYFVPSCGFDLVVGG